MNDKQVNDIVGNVVFNAYQMFSSQPSSMQDKPYPMYSYDRPAALFWSGVAKVLADAGYDYDQIEEFLRSKNTRWMLDMFEDKVEALGEEIAKDYLEGGL